MRRPGPARRSRRVFAVIFLAALLIVPLGFLALVVRARGLAHEHVVAPIAFKSPAALARPAAVAAVAAGAAAVPTTGVPQQPNAVPMVASASSPPLSDAMRHAPIMGGGVPPAVSKDEVTILIIFCYDRPQYLERTLASVLSRMPKVFNGGELHTIISQDGDNPGVATVARRFVEDATQRGFRAEHVQHPRDWRQANLRGSQAAYYMLAQHYGWGLKLAFDRTKTRRVIILEDDLELAVDFFAYFEAFVPLLDDPAEDLLAVSAWNDHGQAKFVSGGEPDAFYRSDFFPGLGWMMSRRVWDGHLKAIWPDSYWDDWLREPDRRRGRHTIRPLMSRTITFGRQGASMGQFFDSFLSPMVLNTSPVDYAKFNVNSLRKDAFDGMFLSRVRQARSTSPDALRFDGSDQRIVYNGLDDYRRICHALGMMDDIKASVPRGAYKGVVPVVMSGSTHVFIAPAGL